jgi:protein transport protein SEC61 subunit beta
MLKLYTDDSPGLRVYVSLTSPPPPFSPPLIPTITTSDPFIVLVLSLSFIASIFFLHISAKIIRAISK